MKRKELENLLYIALRFKPEQYGIRLNSDGWTPIDELIYKINFLNGEEILDRTLLYKIVNGNSKFTINIFKTKIKANKVEGFVHDVLQKTVPPDILYYISQQPLVLDRQFVLQPEGNSQYVVLKNNYPYGVNRNCIAIIDSRQMLAAGYKFYLNNNGDFLTDAITVQFIKQLGGEF
jgi:putative RNA 2'-phosphotransferase